MVTNRGLSIQPVEDGMAGRGGLRSTLAGGVAAGALIWGGQAQAAASPDEQEARIARLEAAVAALQAQVQSQDGLKQANAELRQQDAALKDEVTTLEAQVADLKT